MLARFGHCTNTEIVVDTDSLIEQRSTDSATEPFKLYTLPQTLTSQYSLVEMFFHAEDHCLNS